MIDRLFIGMCGSEKRGGFPCRNLCKCPHNHKPRHLIQVGDRVLTIVVWLYFAHIYTHVHTDYAEKRHLDDIMATALFSGAA